MISRRWWEAIIGVTQVTGQLVGSTTLTGACIYEVATVAWWVWMFTGQMWGFLPINIAGLAVSSYTLWHFL
jgi:hypothetical protein